MVVPVSDTTPNIAMHVIRYEGIQRKKPMGVLSYPGQHFFPPAIRKFAVEVHLIRLSLNKLRHNAMLRDRFNQVDRRCLLPSILSLQSSLSGCRGGRAVRAYPSR